jgi:hypothetical protein
MNLGFSARLAGGLPDSASVTACNSFQSSPLAAGDLCKPAHRSFLNRANESRIQVQSTVIVSRSPEANGKT